MTAIAIERMIAYNAPDVRRINHALKVYGFASAIARREGLSPKELLVVDIAAVLHDIGIREAERKHNSCSGHYQEIEGPAVARDLLSGIEIDPVQLDRICYLIGNHHSYQKIDGVDFQILVEADFLVNIFEEEMSLHSVESIRTKYFKTKTGIDFLEKMHLS